MMNIQGSLLKAVVASCLMVGTLLLAFTLRPNDSARTKASTIDLELLVPKQFGQWKHDSQSSSVVNPQAKALLDKIYSQILTRTYVNERGERVMLSIAYGSDQRGALQAHKPEACYPAQGFLVTNLASANLITPLGDLPVNRMMASKGNRFEPVTYWFTVGDQRVQTAMERRVIELKSVVTGQIPDGLLFRVSSLDRDPKLGYALQDRFVNQLISALPPSGRTRLAGLAPE
jgi:EpsI family protein